MDYIEERKKIVEYGKQMITNNLTTGTGGNLSIYIPEKKVMLISPSGIDYFKTKLEDVVVMDLYGNVLEGGKKPSSEYELHSIFYRHNPEVRAVVHAHADYATACACLRINIPPLHYIMADIGDELRCTDYKIYGSSEIAQEAYRVMGKNKGILLANHGLLAIGKDIDSAMGIARNIEMMCKLYIRASSIGNPVILSKEEMAAVKKKFETYGQVKDKK
ncbi:L-fuculose-phosphate aldolase [Lactobacillus intestinalis]|uniref:L-fuculose-phosphate aldolase n=1 Tax=Lactobacillus intestinalis TaxID=151781 RepID=UPI001F570528|nr:L-fuculose-phosphate aldolase [Lactobacillus intestinalis]